MPAAEYINTSTGLVPSDDAARAVAAKYKIGERVFLSHPSQRSARQNRYYHAVCQIVADNCEQFSSAEEVKDSAKLYAGHCRTTHIKYGGEWYERKAPLSITELGHDGFNTFMDRVLDYFVIELGIDADLLALETQNYAPPSLGKGAAGGTGAASPEAASVPS